MTESNTAPGVLVEEVGRAFLARRLNTLAELIAEQGQSLLADKGGALDARLSSTLYAVHARPGASVADIAEALGLSHQLASYRIKALRQAGLISQSRDPRDRKRYVIGLTREGGEALAALERSMDAACRAYDALFEEIGGDLFALAGRAIGALRARPLKMRAQADR